MNSENYMSLLAHSKNLIKDFDIKLIFLGSLLLGWPSVIDLFLVKVRYFNWELKTEEKSNKDKKKKKNHHSANTMLAKALFAHFY